MNAKQLRLRDDRFFDHLRVFCPRRTCQREIDTFVSYEIDTEELRESTARCTSLQRIIHHDGVSRSGSVNKQSQLFFSTMSSTVQSIFGGVPTTKRPALSQKVPSITDQSGAFHHLAHDDDRPAAGFANKIFINLTYALFFGLLFAYTLVILFGETWFLPHDYADWCHAAQEGYPDPVRNYANPDSTNNPCYYERTLYLLGLNQFETTFSRRMIVSVLLGGAIGFERKAADRPAGVRTMSLVALGSSFFTMCGQHAFRSSPQEFDAARVSAAIPSGVGFLGSALIWKHSASFRSDGSGGGHEVHGLTTAASVWLSASIGIGAGGGLFLLSAYATALVIFVLRIGPRMFLVDDLSSVVDDDEEEDDDDDFDEEDESEIEPRGSSSRPDDDEERRPILSRGEMSSSRRSMRGELQEQASSRRSMRGDQQDQASLRSIREGSGLQRRRSKASLATFGS